MLFDSDDEEEDDNMQKKEEEVRGGEEEERRVGGANLSMRNVYSGGGGRGAGVGGGVGGREGQEVVRNGYGEKKTVGAAVGAPSASGWNVNVNSGKSNTTVSMKGKLTKNPFMEHKKHLAKKQKVRMIGVSDCFSPLLFLPCLPSFHGWSIHVVVSSEQLQLALATTPSAAPYYH